MTETAQVEASVTDSAPGMATGMAEVVRPAVIADMETEAETAAVRAAMAMETAAGPDKATKTGDTAMGVDMQETNMKNELIGKHVIVRSSDSGVHFGTLTEWDNNTVMLTDSRRLWEWHTGGTGVSLSEIAICGIDAARSKITMTLPLIVILGVCEIIPCHGMAIATITGANVFKP